MSRITDYLGFLIKATNHHGVHSPFLFNYLTQCLYKGNWRYPSKAIGIAVKSVPYFGVKSMGFLPESPENERILKLAFPDVHTGNPPFDLVWTEHPNAVAEGLSVKNIPIFHNNTLCVIRDIHGSVDKKRGWNQLKKQPPVRVTVDAFHSGLVFFREELSEQHFKIRI